MFGKVILKDEKIIDRWSMIAKRSRESLIKDERIRKILVGG